MCESSSRDCRSRRAEGMRHVPVEGILPTDAELDHTLGIALLREGRALQLYATHAVLEVLNRGLAGPAGDIGVRGRGGDRASARRAAARCAIATVHRAGSA